MYYGWEVYMHRRDRRIEERIREMRNLKSNLKRTSWSSLSPPPPSSLFLFIKFSRLSFCFNNSQTYCYLVVIHELFLLRCSSSSSVRVHIDILLTEFPSFVGLEMLLSLVIAASILFLEASTQSRPNQVFESNKGN